MNEIVLAYSLPVIDEGNNDREMTMHVYVALNLYQLYLDSSTDAELPSDMRHADKITLFASQCVNELREPIDNLIKRIPDYENMNDVHLLFELYGDDEVCLRIIEPSTKAEHMHQINPTVH